MELLRNSKDKKARKLTKKRVSVCLIRLWSRWTRSGSAGKRGKGDAGERREAVAREWESKKQSLQGANYGWMLQNSHEAPAQLEETPPLLGTECRCNVTGWARDDLVVVRAGLAQSSSQHVTMPDEDRATVHGSQRDGIRPLRRPTLCGPACLATIIPPHRIPNHISSPRSSSPIVAPSQATITYSSPSSVLQLGTLLRSKRKLEELQTVIQESRRQAAH